MFDYGEKVNRQGAAESSPRSRTEGVGYPVFESGIGDGRMNGAVAVETLGCRLNQAESEAMATALVQEGYRLVSPSDGADVYILNTCTVTHVADRKCRHLLRLARRRNPQALVIAVGCYPHRAPEELGAMDEVDIVLGNEEKDAVLDIVRGRGASGPVSAMGPSAVLRTRSMVKVQEGCSQFCSYCIVPFVRGRERSRPVDEVVSEVGDRVSAGYREATLTGTEIGAYQPSLVTLVHRILAETRIARLRLSSLRPGDLTPQLLSLWDDDRLCPHVHLPLQSGSDDVLRRMGRPYSVAEYQRAVSAVREAVADVAITTDVVVGFPGETDEEFEESYRFCRMMGFAGIHVFSYSDRPGTSAATMPGKVSPQVKGARSGRMLELAGESARRFRQQFIGRSMTVLWEREIEEGVWTGLTENYIRVLGRSHEPLRNALTPAAPSGWRNGHLWATPEPSSARVRGARR